MHIRGSRTFSCMDAKEKATKGENYRSKYFHSCCTKTLQKKYISCVFQRKETETNAIYSVIFVSFTPQFSFEDCNFNIQRSKENTARVVVWLMGVENSYTMEASFCGSSLGSRANTHLGIKDFEDIGQTFCETLLDYYNEDPRNVCYLAFFLNLNIIFCIY